MDSPLDSNVFADIERFNKTVFRQKKDWLSAMTQAEQLLQKYPKNAHVYHLLKARLLLSDSAWTTPPSKVLGTFASIVSNIREPTPFSYLSEDRLPFVRTGVKLIAEGVEKALECAAASWDSVHSYEAAALGIHCAMAKLYLAYRNLYVAVNKAEGAVPWLVAIDVEEIRDRLPRMNSTTDLPRFEESDKNSKHWMADTLENPLKMKMKELEVIHAAAEKARTLLQDWVVRACSILDPALARTVPATPIIRLQGAPAHIGSEFGIGVSLDASLLNQEPPPDLLKEQEKRGLMINILRRKGLLQLTTFAGILASPEAFKQSLSTSDKSPPTATDDATAPPRLLSPTPTPTPTPTPSEERRRAMIEDLLRLRTSVVGVIAATRFESAGALDKSGSFANGIPAKAIAWINYHSSRQMLLSALNSAETVKAHTSEAVFKEMAQLFEVKEGEHDGFYVHSYAKVMYPYLTALVTSGLWDNRLSPSRLKDAGSKLANVPSVQPQQSDAKRDEAIPDLRTHPVDFPAQTLAALPLGPAGALKTREFAERLARREEGDPGSAVFSWSEEVERAKAGGKGGRGQQRGGSKAKGGASASAASSLFDGLFENVEGTIASLGASRGASEWGPLRETWDGAGEEGRSALLQVDPATLADFEPPARSPGEPSTSGKGLEGACLRPRYSCRLCAIAGEDGKSGCSFESMEGLLEHLVVSHNTPMAKLEMTFEECLQHWNSYDWEQLWPELLRPVDKLVECMAQKEAGDGLLEHPEVDRTIETSLEEIGTVLEKMVSTSPRYDETGPQVPPKCPSCLMTEETKQTRSYEWVPYPLWNENLDRGHFSVWEKNKGTVYGGFFARQSTSVSWRICEDEAQKSFQNFKLDEERRTLCEKTLRVVDLKRRMKRLKTREALCPSCFQSLEARREIKQRFALKAQLDEEKKEEKRRKDEEARKEGDAKGGRGKREKALTEKQMVERAEMELDCLYALPGWSYQDPTTRRVLKEMMKESMKGLVQKAISEEVELPEGRVPKDQLERDELEDVAQALRLLSSSDSPPGSPPAPSAPDPEEGDDSDVDGFGGLYALDDEDTVRARGLPELPRWTDDVKDDLEGLWSGTQFASASSYTQGMGIDDAWEGLDSLFSSDLFKDSDLGPVFGSALGGSMDLTPQGWPDRKEARPAWESRFSSEYRMPYREEMSFSTSAEVSRIRSELDERVARPLEERLKLVQEDKKEEDKKGTRAPRRLGQRPARGAQNSEMDESSSSEEEGIVVFDLPLLSSVLAGLQLTLKNALQLGNHRRIAAAVLEDGYGYSVRGRSAFRGLVSRCTYADASLDPEMCRFLVHIVVHFEMLKYISDGPRRVSEETAKSFAHAARVCAIVTDVFGMKLPYGKCDDGVALRQLAERTKALLARSSGPDRIPFMRAKHKQPFLSPAVAPSTSHGAPPLTVSPSWLERAVLRPLAPSGLDPKEAVFRWLSKDLEDPVDVFARLTALHLDRDRGSSLAECFTLISHLVTHLGAAIARLETLNLADEGLVIPKDKCWSQKMLTEALPDPGGETFLVASNRGAIKDALASTTCPLTDDELTSGLAEIERTLLQHPGQRIEEVEEIASLLAASSNKLLQVMEGHGAVLVGMMRVQLELAMERKVQYLQGCIFQLCSHWNTFVMPYLYRKLKHMDELWRALAGLREAKKLDRSKAERLEAQMAALEEMVKPLKESIEGGTVLQRRLKNSKGSGGVLLCKIGNLGDALPVIDMKNFQAECEDIALEVGKVVRKAIDEPVAKLGREEAVVQYVGVKRQVTAGLSCDKRCSPRSLSDTLPLITKLSEVLHSAFLDNVERLSLLALDLSGPSLEDAYRLAVCKNLQAAHQRRAEDLRRRIEEDEECTRRSRQEEELQRKRRDDEERKRREEEERARRLQREQQAEEAQRRRREEEERARRAQVAARGPRIEFSDSDESDEEPAKPFAPSLAPAVPLAAPASSSALSPDLASTMRPTLALSDSDVETSAEEGDVETILSTRMLKALDKFAEQERQLLRGFSGSGTVPEAAAPTHPQPTPKQTAQATAPIPSPSVSSKPAATTQQKEKEPPPPASAAASTSSSKRKRNRKGGNKGGAQEEEDEDLSWAVPGASFSSKSTTDSRAKAPSNLLAPFQPTLFCRKDPGIVVLDSNALWKCGNCSAINRFTNQGRCGNCEGVFPICKQYVKKSFGSVLEACKHRSECRMVHPRVEVDRELAKAALEAMVMRGCVTEETALKALKEIKKGGSAKRGLTVVAVPVTASSAAAPAVSTSASAPSAVAVTVRREVPAAAPSTSSYASAASAVSTAAVAMRNDEGEYNCFLNVLIQSLWHLRAFREVMLQANPAPAPGPEGEAAVLQALRQIFASIDRKEKAQAGVIQGGESEALLAPTNLRDALSARFGEIGLFKHGEMNDAAEALQAILECLDRAEGERPDSWVRRLFGLNLHHVMNCTACGLKTLDRSWNQLCEQVQAFVMRLSGLAGTLRSDKFEKRSCDKDVGGCGEFNEVVYSLKRPLPQLYTVMVSWDSPQPSLEEVRDYLNALHRGMELRLKSIYQGLSGDAVYSLRSMICYYGQHYMAFAREDGGDAKKGPEACKWVFFDDHRTRPMESFRAVLEYCLKGKLMPVVLLFEQVKRG